MLVYTCSLLHESPVKPKLLIHVEQSFHILQLSVSHCLVLESGLSWVEPVLGSVFLVIGSKGIVIMGHKFIQTFLPFFHPFFHFIQLWSFCGMLNSYFRNSFKP